MHLNTFLEIQVQESMSPTLSSSIWKYDENTIVIEFFILSYGLKNLICINVFLNFSCYGHNLSNFSY